MPIQLSPKSIQIIFYLEKEFPKDLNAILLKIQKRTFAEKEYQNPIFFNNTILLPDTPIIKFKDKNNNAIQLEQKKLDCVYLFQNGQENCLTNISNKIADVFDFLVIDLNLKINRLAILCSQTSSEKHEVLKELKLENFINNMDGMNLFLHNTLKIDEQVSVFDSIRVIYKSEESEIVINRQYNSGAVSINVDQAFFEKVKNKVFETLGKDNYWRDFFDVK